MKPYEYLESLPLFEREKEKIRSTPGFEYPVALYHAFCFQWRATIMWLGSRFDDKAIRQEMIERLEAMFTPDELFRMREHRNVRNLSKAVLLLVFLILLLFVMQLLSL